MNNKLIFTVLFTFIFSLMAHTQNDSREIVNKYHPQVYQSIMQFALSTWKNEPQMQEYVFESQAEAFLDITQPRTPLDKQVLITAILDNSIKGEEEYNKQIINDPTIKEPFSLLRCNWYMAKEQYQKVTNSQLKTKNTDIYNRIAQDSEKTGTEDSYESSKNISLEDEFVSKDKRSLIGIRVGYGISSVRGFSNYGTITKNEIYDLALFNNYKLSKLVFLQTDLTFDHISMDLHDDVTDYRLIVNKMSLRMYAGLYKKLAPKIKIMAGVGGFGGLLTRNKQRELYLKARPVSFGVAGYDYGVNGLAAVELNRIQISVVATMSLQNLSDYNLGLRGQSAFLGISYLF